MFTFDITKVVDNSYCITLNLSVFDFKLLKLNNTISIYVLSSTFRFKGFYFLVLNERVLSFAYQYKVDFSTQ